MLFLIFLEGDTYKYDAQAFCAMVFSVVNEQEQHLPPYFSVLSLGCVW